MRSSVCSSAGSTPSMPAVWTASAITLIRLAAALSTPDSIVR
jgi:hypothetical protein